jgi:hypothetical protein
MKEKPKSFIEAVKQELARGLAMPEAVRCAKEKYPHLYTRHIIVDGGQPDPRFN